MSIVTRLFKGESGSSTIEYGLIAALISVVCIDAMTVVGRDLTAVRNRIAATLAA
jgi:Flp pilus assembly pilin Flp